LVLDTHRSQPGQTCSPIDTAEMSGNEHAGRLGDEAVHRRKVLCGLDRVETVEAVPTVLTAWPHGPTCQALVRCCRLVTARSAMMGVVSPSSIQDVPVAELPIRLGQFLKLAGLAEHGAHARELVETDQVQVNGQVEVRRGAQLHAGDVVTVAGRRARPVT
jgi:ribosome-associated protein